MRAFATMIGAAVLLAGCSGGPGNETAVSANEANGMETVNQSAAAPVLPPAAEPANDASAQTAAAQPSSWAGTYEGKLEGDATGSLEIKPGSNGRLNVDLGVGSPGCAGGVTYRNVTPPSGDILVLTKPEDDYQCRLTLKRSGRSIVIEEEDCNAHGAECSFQGSVKR